MKVRISIETGFAGADYDEVIEVDDNATEEEIQEEVNNYVFEKISCGYQILPKEEEDEKK